MSDLTLLEMFTNIFDHIKLPNKMRNFFLFFALLLINSVALAQLNVKAITVNAPIDGMCPGTNQTISVKIRNDGASAINFALTNITISVNIVGANPQSYSMVISSGLNLPSGGTRAYVLTTTANLSKYGKDSYQLSATGLGDVSPGIDAVEDINVYGNFIDLTSVLSSSNQTVCLNSPLTSITYDVSGNATDATASGLPTGVTYSFTYPTLTITGNPSDLVGSPFAYSVTATGSCPASDDSTLTGSISVSPLPIVSITGLSGICIGSTSQLSPAVGGTWVSSDNSIATVNNAGLVTAIGAGSATFTFTSAATSCSNTTLPITVTAPPVSGVLSGVQAICIAGTSNFSSTSLGGSWSSSDNLIASTTASGVITGVGAGTATMTYTVLGTGGCANVSDIRTVTVTAPPSTGVLSGTQAFCFPGSTIFSSTFASGTWSSSDPTVATITSGGNVVSISAGTATMTYTVTGSGGCTDATDTRTVTITAAPTTGVLSGNQAICIAGTTTFSSTVLGGSWSSSSALVATTTSAGLVTGVGAGTATMTYTVLGTGGCSNATDTRTVTITAPPATGVLGGTQGICLPGTSIFNSSIGGGNWTSSNPLFATITSGGNITAVGAGIATMTYTVTGTGGCSDATDTRTLTVTAPPVAGVLSGGQAICIAGTTNFASTIAGGSWSSADVSIATTDAAGLVTGVAAGTINMIYTVTGTGGCSDVFATRSVTVTAPPDPGVLSGNQAICLPGNTSFSSTIAGGTWTSGTPAIATINATGDITAVSAGSSIISYKVSGTGGCTDVPTTRTVTVTTPPTAGVLSGNQGICELGTTNFSSTIPGGSWASSDPSIASTTVGGVITGVGAGTTTMTYTVTGTGGCSDVSDVRTVTVTAPPSAGVLSGTQAICNAGSSIFASTVPGGTWTSVNPLIATITAGGNILAVSVGSTTMNYTVTGTGGCSDVTDTRTLTVSAPLSAGTLSGNQAICVGGTTTFIPTVAGGSWSSDDITIATVDLLGHITGIGAGTATITYTITGLGGCSDVTTTRTVTITAPPTPGLLSGSQAICIAGSTVFSSSVPVGTWISNDNTIATITAGGNVAAVAVGSATMTYTVTGTGGCSDVSDTRTVTVSASPTAGVLSGSQTICAGGTSIFSSTVGGGSWTSATPAIATISSTGDILGVSAGVVVMTYTVTGTGGCADVSNTRSVTVKALPVVNAITGSNTGCVGDEIQLANTTNGGVWSSSDLTIASVDNFGLVTALTNGSVNILYTVTANGCSASSLFPLIINVIPVVNSITGSTTVCQGLTTQLSDLTAAGTWTSDNLAVATVNGTGLVTGVTGGSANITYSVTFLGCVGEATTTVTVQALPSVAAISGNNTVCTGGTSQLSNITPGGTWSSSSLANATIDAAGLITGVTAGSTTITYSITNAGCTNSRTLSVTVNTSPIVSLIVGASSVCLNNTTQLTNVTNGGTWDSDDSGIASVDQNGLVTAVAAGTTNITYSMTSSGCTTVQTHTITVYDFPVVTPIIGNTSICISSTSQLANATLGGVWSSASPAVATISPLGVVSGVSVGSSVISYTVTTNGCATTVTSTVTISSAAVLGAITGTSTICNGLTSQLANAVPGGSWVSSNPAVATINATGLVTGVSAGSSTITYSLISGGCTSTNTLVFTVNAVPSVAPITGLNTVCTGNSLQLATITSGGSWISSDATIATVNSSGLVTPVTAGNVTISYSKTQTGCTGTANFPITINSSPFVAPITGNTNLCVGSTSSLSSATIAGNWSSASPLVASIDALGNVNALSAGVSVISYSLTLSGCTTTNTTTVTVNSLPVVSSITGSNSVCIGNTTPLSNSTNGGTWTSSSPLIASINASGLVTGLTAGVANINYMVITNGCSTTKSFTVNVNPFPSVAPITGTLDVCVGNTTQLSDVTLGGTWSSASTGIATVNAFGLVTGVSNGTSVITYALTTNGCTTNSTTTVNVNSALIVSSIIGTTDICLGSNSQLTNSTNGGSWSSSNPAVAIVNSSGLVTSVSVGSTTISYNVVTNGVCPQFASVIFNVNAIPTVDDMVDVSACQGSMFSQVNFSGTGNPTYAWSNSNTLIGLAASGVGSILSFQATGTTVGGPSKTAVIQVTPNANGCIGTMKQFFMTVNPLENPGFNYSNSSYCLSDANPSPVVSGQLGGTFSSSPLGLSIVGSTGVISLSSSTPGYYAVKYTTNGTCSNDSIVNISVAGSPTVASVLDQTVCQGTAFNAINFFGAPGTSFSWTNSDASIGLASSGTGNISAFSASGTVVGGPSKSATIIVTPIAGSCIGAKDTFNLRVNSLDDATFTYPSNSFCSTLDSDPIANITGKQGGVFNVLPVGTTYNSNTGFIDLSASASGVYTLTYQTNGQCPNTSSASIAIGDIASVNPILSQEICLGTSFNPINFTGSPGTSFNWTANNTSVGIATSGSGNIPSFIGIGASTLNPTVSSTITVVPKLGSCIGVSQTFKLTVNNKDNVSIAYSDVSYCLSNTNPIPVVTGQSGGDFSATPGGLIIDPLSGLINIAASSQGVYNVMYKTSGTCADTSIVSVAINFSPSVNNISDQVKCAGRSFVSVNFSGTLGTTFDWTNNNTSIGLVSSGTGNINAFVSTNSSNVIQMGTVIVTPRSGACIGIPKSFNLTVNPVDNASFSYSSNNICFSNSTISPTITGTPGGVFTTNLSSLSINNSGVINVGISVPGTYNVTYTTSGVCNDVLSQVITINPLPIVDPVLPQTVCEGSSFSPINLTGGTLSTVYNWTNSNSSLGLGKSGVGSISSFVGTGTTQGGNPNSAVVTVTPSIGSCIGASKTFVLTVNSIDNPSFSYSDNSYCLNQTNPTPIISGKVGGTFSVTPLTGLSINSVTGTIDLSSSTAGSYIIKYTTNGFCQNDSSVIISVGSSPFVNTISSQVVCQNSNFSAINFIGAPGTIFDWTNSNPLIGLPASGSGNITSFKADGTVIGGISQNSNITVTPRIGSCIGAPISFRLTTNPLDNADFSYANSSYCKNQTNPIPTVTGLSGGSFSSLPIGLSLTSSGVINLVSSTSGYYDVSYTTHGQCPNVSTFAVSIGSAPSVSLVQSQSVCLGSDFQSIQFQGNLGTIFNWTNSNASIGLASSGTGDIPSFTSQSVGSSIVVVTPVIGSCVGTPRTFNLTVNSVQSSTINYGQSSYCTSDADPTPIVLGPLNGNFTFTPSGLQMNASTGLVDISNSSAGTYTVFYNLTGACSTSSSTSISIGTGPTVNSIQPITVCNGSQVNPLVFSGSLGTQFSWTNSNNSIGLSASGNGNIVSFTATNASGSNKTATITVTPKIGTCVGVSKSFSITVYPSDNASFGYTNSNYCINSSDAIPTITGTSGGTFSFTPNGLSFIPASGRINISNSTPATYNITYITPGVCPKAATQTIVINPMPSATAIVPQNACQGSLFNAVNITGTANTTFNWLNNNTSIGLMANGNSVIPAFIASGTLKNGSNNTAKITITPQINGCLGQDIDVTYTVNSIDDATFSYSKNSFCQGDPNPIAQITGTNNGTFSSIPIGLDLISTTGEIRIATSVIGAYNVKYRTLGFCPVDTTIGIVINPLATVNPVSSLEKCKGDLFPSVQFSGSLGSTFTWVNTNTAIGLLASGSGNIGSFTANGTSFGGSPIIGNITVTPQINGCVGASTSFTYKVNPIGNPAFAYADNSFCLVQSDPSPVVSGTPAGTFSSTPFGLTLSQSTGQITLSSSTPGIYQITYTTPGACPDDSTVSIGIGSNPSVNDIDDQSLCDGDAFDKVDFTGNPGTIFEWTNTNVNVGIPLLGTNDIASFVAKGTISGGSDEVSTITVTPRIGTCIGTARSYKYKVRAKPNIQATIQNSVSIDTSFCKGGNAKIVATGASKNEYYTWTPNNLLVGNQLTGSTVVTKTDSTQQYIVRGQSQYGCYNFDTVTVYVYNPKVLSITDTTVCAGTPFNKIAFKGNVPTPYFEWTNSNPTIGLTFNGSGDITPFIGVNNSSQTKQTALISVTPKYTIPSTGKTCVGVQTKFSLNVIKRDDASFSGYLSQYCANEIANTKPTILGAIGGEFSVRPISGLALNSLTGQIFPSSSASGNYTVKYTTKGTCPKSDSIDLFINPLITATISGSDTVCINDISPNIVFKGINGVAPYTFTYKINNGTSQIITTGVGEDEVSLPIPTSTAGVFNVSLVSVRESSALVCSNNSLNANVTIKVNSLPTAQIMGTTTVCEGGAQPEILLTGLNGTAPFTFNYVINGVPQNPIQTSIGSVNAKLYAPTNVAGIFNYSIVGVIDASCSTIQPLNPSAAITVKPLPSANIKSSSSSICMNGVAEMEFEGINGLAPFTFTYKVNNGNNQIVKSVGVNSKVKITIPTNKVDKLVYSLVSVQDASQTSCTNSLLTGKDSITIIAGATVKALVDTTVCVGSKTNAIVFTGTQGATYTWVTNNTTIGIPSGGANNIPSFVGINTSNSLSNSALITVSPSIGICKGEVMQFTISVRPLPRPQVKPIAPICPGDSVLLEGVGPYNYVWTPDNSLSCFTCNPVKAKPTKTTNYKIYATDVYGCSDTTDFDVVVFDPPIVKGNDMTICGDPDTIQLVGTGAATYTWTNGVVNGKSFMPINGVSTYVVTGTDIRGCKNSDSVTVTVLPKPIPLFTANTTSGLASYVKPLNILLTNNSSQADNYEWNFRNGEPLLNKTTKEPVTALYRLPGKYVITLTAYNGICLDSSSIEIKVEKLDTPSVLIAPNVFSPNNDGVNDEFYLTVKNVKTLKLVIYNRWGNPIHEISETSPVWDGKINGANADEGVYFYEYEIEGSDGEKVPGQGFIQLIRN